MKDEKDKLLKVIDRSNTLNMTMDTTPTHSMDTTPTHSMDTTHTTHTTHSVENHNNNILQHFWNLSSLVEENRISAAKDLLSSLESDLMNFRKNNFIMSNVSNENILSSLDILFQFKNDTTSSTNHTSTTTAISIIRDSAIFPENVSYSLKRLVRGLSSSRDGARLGFATALKELLSILPELPVGLYLCHLHQTSESNGKKSGQEEREFYFARIFGYYAMALSGMLTSIPTFFDNSILSSPNRDFTATLNDINLVTENLLVCCKQKDYLKVSATFCALQVLKAIQSHSTGATSLSDAIIKKWLENGISTPEHVWFALEAQKIHPTCSAWPTLLADWKKTDILYSKNKSKLLEILKSASFYHDHDPQDFASSPPQNAQNEKQITTTLHPIFQALVDGMQNPPPNSCRMSLFEFWGLIEPFFFASHSHDRKSMGFLFLTLLVLPCCQPNQISLVFTKLFMRCLINSLSSSDTKLNKQARFTTNILTLQAQKSPSLALPLLGQLIGINGHFKFDQITRTKTVETLLSILSEKDVEEHFEFLDCVFKDTQSLVPQQERDQEDNRVNANSDTIRLWVVDQIYLLLKTPKIKKSKRIVEIALDWLVSIGVGEWTNGVPNNETIRKSCREKIVTSLSYLSHLLLPDEEKVKAGHCTSSQTWLSFLHSLLVEKTKSQKGDDELRNVLVKSSESSLRMVQEKNNPSASLSVSELDCFQKVFETLGIVFYCDTQDQDPEKGIDTMNEVNECISKMMQPKSSDSGSKRKRQEGEEQEGQLEPVEVLVDLLISFLAKPSAVLRALAVDVFKVIAKKANTKAVLDLFIEVLSVHSGVQGAQELFEEEGHDEAQDEQDSSSDDEEEEDRKNGKEEEENAMPVDEELRAKIQAALEMDVEQDLEELGDDEMEAFDSKLAEIFSQRKSIKNVKKESKETVLHFKLRVLDLLDLFLKSSASSSLFLNAIEPLLELYQSTSQSSDSTLIHKKLGSIIKSRMVHSKETILFNQETRKECLQVFQKLLETCRKWNDEDGILNGIVLVLVKHLVHPSNQVSDGVGLEKEPPKKKKKEKKKDESAVAVLNVQKEIIKIYTSAFTHWMNTKNSKIRPMVFTCFSTRYPLLALDLVSEMLKSTTDSSMKPKSFQLVKTFEMTAIFLKNVPKVSCQEEKTRNDLMKLSLSYISCLSSILENAGDMEDKGPFGMPKDRIKTLLKSLGVVIRKIKILVTDSLWVPESLPSLLERVSNHERFKCAAVTSLVKQTNLLLKP